MAKGNGISLSRLSSVAFLRQLSTQRLGDETSAHTRFAKMFTHRVVSAKWANSDGAHVERHSMGARSGRPETSQWGYLLGRIPALLRRTFFLQTFVFSRQVTF